jgi:uncharacterized protein (DUF1330 family)
VKRTSRPDAYNQKEIEMAEKGYLFAEVEVFNPEHFQVEYASKVGAILSQFGGKILVAGGNPEVVEGGRKVSRVFVVEFESVDRMKAFYESDVYQSIAPARVQSSHSHFYLLTGV